jgi:hypothetical protein
MTTNNPIFYIRPLFEPKLTFPSKIFELKTDEGSRKFRILCAEIRLRGGEITTRT